MDYPRILSTREVSPWKSSIPLRLIPGYLARWWSITRPCVSSTWAWLSPTRVETPVTQAPDGTSYFGVPPRDQGFVPKSTHFNRIFLRCFFQAGRSSHVISWDASCVTKAQIHINLGAVQRPDHGINLITLWLLQGGYSKQQSSSIRLSEKQVTRSSFFSHEKSSKW